LVDSQPLKHCRLSSPHPPAPPCKHSQYLFLLDSCEP
jgi:hypothetical protein